MISLENLHRNKKWAFIDGLCCGALAVYLYTKKRNALAVDEAEKLSLAERDRIWWEGNAAGHQTERSLLSYFVDEEKYAKFHGIPFKI